MTVSQTLHVENELRESAGTSRTSGRPTELSVRRMKESAFYWTIFIWSRLLVFTRFLYIGKSDTIIFILVLLPRV